jgi:hypothetical protein
MIDEVATVHPCSSHHVRATSAHQGVSCGFLSQLRHQRIGDPFRDQRLEGGQFGAFLLAARCLNCSPTDRSLRHGEPSAGTTPRSITGLDNTGCADQVTIFAENSGPMFCPRTSGPPQCAHTIGGRLFVGWVFLLAFDSAGSSALTRTYGCLDSGQ